MFTDRYTKIVLTIIAACLVWISIGGPSLLPTAQASSQSQARPEPQVVYVAGWVAPGGIKRDFNQTANVAEGVPVWAIPAR